MTQGTSVPGLAPSCPKGHPNQSTYPVQLLSQNANLQFRSSQLRISLETPFFRSLLGFPLGALRRNVEPDLIFRSWIDLFPRYWDSWHNFGPYFKPDDVGDGVYMCAAFILLTKVAAGFISPAYLARKRLDAAET